MVRFNNPESKLEPKNEVAVQQEVKTFGKGQTYTNLLLLIADVLDYAVEGHDSYMTIGQTRDKTALLLSVHQDGKHAYVSGTSLAGLSEAAGTLL